MMYSQYETFEETYCCVEYILYLCCSSVVPGMIPWELVRNAVMVLTAELLTEEMQGDQSPPPPHPPPHEPDAL